MVCKLRVLGLGCGLVCISCGQKVDRCLPRIIKRPAESTKRKVQQHHKADNPITSMIRGLLQKHFDRKAEDPYTNREIFDFK